MSDPSRPLCTSASNCLVVDEISGGAEVMLRSTRHPNRPGILDVDEWQAHLAEVRAAALTEAADAIDAYALPMKQLPNRLLDEGLRGELGGLEKAAAVIGHLAAVPPPSATLPADDAPAVPEQAPGPQGPAEDDCVDCARNVFHDRHTTAAEHRADIEQLTAALAEASGHPVQISTSEAQSPTEDPVLLAAVHRIRALRTERDNLIDMLQAREAELAAMRLSHIATVDGKRVAYEAAAQLHDELNRTGEQLLAMTADRDRWRERVDAGAWDTLTAERDQLAETLRSADPWAGAGLDRLADHLIEHWPARVHVANETRQVTADLAIEVLKDLCGQLAGCHAELARTRPVVEAAVEWPTWWKRDPDSDQPERDPGTAVEAYSAGTPQPDGDEQPGGMVGDTHVAWVPQIPTPDGLPPVLGDGHG